MAQFTAQAGVAEATEWQFGKAVQERIDPYGARINFPSSLQADINIFAPYRR
ncbi:hypothetical protein D3C76_1834500 [compost metagenome]